ncbi:MAG: hypothetical protein C4519_00365 [Desulfobacteraceae bacterium]|nr:MAG: hypothetical protein C4519_00365 [Desulfobacteraceae bacterium]
MKRWIIGLVILALIPCVTSGEDYVLVTRKSVTLGKLAAAGTAQRQVCLYPPKPRGMSLSRLDVYVDSLAGRCDSVKIEYREIYGADSSKVYRSYDGEPMDWSPLKIYDGPAGALHDADYGWTLHHACLYPCLLPMDGYIWDGIVLKASHVDSTATPGDSLRLTFLFYWQK